jgi:hypothetical protein
MIVATPIVCHRAMTYNQSSSFYRWFGGSLLLAVLAETANHTITNEQVVHKLSFVSLIIVVAIRTRALIKLRVQDLNDKKMLQKAVIFGAGMYSLTSLSRTFPNSSDRCRRMFYIRLPVLATRLFVLFGAHCSEKTTRTPVGLCIGAPRMVARLDCHWSTCIHVHGGRPHS